MRSILLFIFVVRLNLMRELPTLYYIIVMLMSGNDNNVARSIILVILKYMLNHFSDIKI